MSKIVTIILFFLTMIAAVVLVDLAFGTTQKAAQPSTFVFPTPKPYPTFPPCFPFCNSTPTPTMTPKPTPTNTPTPAPSATPTPTISITPSNTPTPTPTSSPSGGLYYGVYAGSTQFDITQVTNFEALAQKKVSLVSWYQAWANTDGTQNFQTNYMTTVKNHGSMPMVTWEPWNYTAGTYQYNYRLAAIYSGQYDAYITKFAQDSKAWGNPYFLRFGHEMNGNWYPWNESVNYNSPGDYVKAYKHVHDIFTQVGATNVTWVWCPNVVEGMPTSIQSVYPGDSYVDWLCMDGYNWGDQYAGWQTFNQLFQNTYNQLTALSSKPILIGETASNETGGSKATWITNSYGSGIDSMPKIKGIVWFNINKEKNWLINSSPSSLAAFQQAVAQPKF